MGWVRRGQGGTGDVGQCVTRQDGVRLGRVEWSGMGWELHPDLARPQLRHQYLGSV